MLIKPFENKRLFTSLKLILITLKHQNLIPSKLIALDAFCQTGLQWTRIFSKNAHYLEMWDINESAIKYAKKGFSKAVINCGNSIEAFKKKSFGRDDFNFILIDTPLPFQYMETFEHFGFFDDIFNVSDKEVIVILNVAPSIDLITKTHPVHKDYIEKWAKARREFYNTENGMEINPSILINTYTSRIEKMGYSIKLINYNARNEYVGLITLVVKKM